MFFSETHALILELFAPKVAFSPRTLMLDAPGIPRKACPPPCAEGTAVGCKKNMQTDRENNRGYFGINE